MSVHSDIEAAFVELVQSVDGIERALDHEPQRLPSLPCVTMLATQFDQFDAETGTWQDTTYTWQVFLYCKLADYREAQKEIKLLVPRLMAAIRVTPNLIPTGDTIHELRDDAEPPQFDMDAGWVRKPLRLACRQSER